MTYLGEKVMGNFKRGKSLRSVKRKRDGMSPEFLALVRQLPCAADRCYGAIEAHHLCLKEHRGIGMKAPDRYAIPLSNARHTELHRYGTKRHVEILLSWGVDGEALANALWQIFQHEPAIDRLEKMRAAVMGHEAGDQGNG